MGRGKCVFINHIFKLIVSVINVLPQPEVYPFYCDLWEWPRAHLSLLVCTVFVFGGEVCWGGSARPEQEEGIWFWSFSVLWQSAFVCVRVYAHTHTHVCMQVVVGVAHFCSLCGLVAALTLQPVFPPNSRRLLLWSGCGGRPQASWFSRNGPCVPPAATPFLRGLNLSLWKRLLCVSKLLPCLFSLSPRSSCFLQLLLQAGLCLRILFNSLLLNHFLY